MIPAGIAIALGAASIATGVAKFIEGRKQMKAGHMIKGIIQDAGAIIALLIFAVILFVLSVRRTIVQLPPQLLITLFRLVLTIVMRTFGLRKTTRHSAHPATTQRRINYKYMNIDIIHFDIDRKQWKKDIYSTTLN